MISKKVQKVVDKNKIPKDRRCIKSKWLFNIKRNGKYKARLVACEYSQIQRIDFQERQAPVINDVTWSILLITMMKEEYDAKLFM